MKRRPTRSVSASSWSTTALDAAYNGFVEGLKEAGYEEGKNLEIDMNNAQGDQSNCATIRCQAEKRRLRPCLRYRYSGGSGLCNEITDTRF